MSELKYGICVARILEMIMIKMSFIALSLKIDGKNYSAVLSGLLMQIWYGVMSSSQSC